MSAKLRAVLITCLVALLAIGTAAQNRPAAGSTAKPGGASDTTDRAKVIRAAADALGMIRWSDIGAGATRLPGIDVVNTMEFFAAGADSSSGQPVQTEYHVAIGYNPAKQQACLSMLPAPLRCLPAHERSRLLLKRARLIGFFILGLRSGLGDVMAATRRFSFASVIHYVAWES